MSSRTLLACASLLLLVAACGPDGEPTAESSPTPATAATPSPTATAEPTASPSPTQDPDEAATEQDPDEAVGTEPVGAFGTEEVEGGDFPSMTGETVYLTDVRVGAHEGFDRVVLEFEGTSPPSHRIGYIEEPIVQDGSGNPVEVEGSAFLELRMTPASGVDLSGVEYEPIYEGPERVEAPGTGVVTEVVRTGDFEANLAWVVGLEEEAPFAAEWLTDPLRLVVDVSS